MALFLGAQFLRDVEMWREKIMVFWAFQIPIFTSSYVSFNFNTGGAIWVSIDAESNIRFFPFLGSYATLNIGVEATTSVGVNLLAVVIVILLLRHKRSSLEQDPGNQM